MRIFWVDFIFFLYQSYFGVIRDFFGLVVLIYFLFFLLSINVYREIKKIGLIGLDIQYRLVCCRGLAKLERQ